MATRPDQSRREHPAPRSKSKSRFDVETDETGKTGEADQTDDSLAGAELYAALTQAIEATDDEVDVIVHLREQADTEELAAQGAAAGMAAEAVSSATSVAEVREEGKDARAQAVVDGLQQVADGPAQDRVRASLEQLDATDVESYWIVNAVSATLTADAVEALVDHPDVSRIDLDTTITLPETSSEPNLPTWGHEKINAPKTWAEHGYRGEGVVVAVVDSGVDGGHPALAGSYRGADGDHSDSWYAPTGENYPTPGDGNGHGTHVAGTITGDAPGQRIGVAPDAEWIGVKIFDDLGKTSDSIILDASQWLLAPGGDPAKAPDVVNNSWSHPDPTRTAFWDSVAAWSAAGIFPVFANANNGPGSATVGSPASFPMSFGVGAGAVVDRAGGRLGHAGGDGRGDRHRHRRARRGRHRDGGRPGGRGRRGRLVRRGGAAGRRGQRDHRRGHRCPGSPDPQTRTVHRIPLDAEISTLGQGRNPQVVLELTSQSDGSAVQASSARLQVVDAAGEVVRDEPMVWRGVRYFAQLRGISGTYTLQAVVEVEGHTVLVPGPEVAIH